jgi:putative thioredoxin
MRTSRLAERLVELMTDQHSPPHDSGHGPWVIDTTDATFVEDVVQRSHEMPVVVDFWASWCAPCRMLGPVLEKLAAEYDGQFLLVKANTDEAPQAAAQFNVQSIPAVFAVRDGELVHFFQGALPEPQLRMWLDSIMPSPAQQLTAAGKSLQQDHPAEAEQHFRAAMEQDANLAAPRLALAQLLLDQQRWEDCQAVIDQLERRGFLEPEAEKIKAALELHREGTSAPDIATCRADAAANPQDLTLQLTLAESLAAHHEFAEALQVALQVVQQSSGEMRERGRELMVNIFRLLPDDSELTGDYRRKLASALF